MDYQSLREHRELIKARENTELSNWRTELQEEGDHPYVDVMPQTNKVEDQKKKEKKEKKEQLDVDFLMDTEVEQLDEILGLGKKPTPEEVKAKKLKQLERLYKVVKDPHSDIAPKKKPVKVVQREEVEPVEEENKEVEAQFQRARTPFMLSKFRKEHPGSRQPKKVPGAKETEGEAAARRRGAQAERAAKHGLTSKEKKETQARDKYYSARD